MIAKIRSVKHASIGMCEVCKLPVNEQPYFMDENKKFKDGVFGHKKCLENRNN